MGFAGVVLILCVVFRVDSFSSQEWPEVLSQCWGWLATYGLGPYFIWCLGLVLILFSCGASCSGRCTRRLKGLIGSDGIIHTSQWMVDKGRIVGVRPLVMPRWVGTMGAQLLLWGLIGSFNNSHPSVLVT